MRAEQKPGGRLAALQARINAAQQRLAENKRLEWAEIGTMLEAFSRDLEHMDAADPARRDAACDEIDRHLDAIHAKLDTARPTD